MGRFFFFGGACFGVKRWGERVTRRSHTKQVRANMKKQTNMLVAPIKGMGKTNVHPSKNEVFGPPKTCCLMVLGALGATYFCRLCCVCLFSEVVFGQFLSCFDSGGHGF